MKPLNRSAAACAVGLLAYVVAPAPWATLAYFSCGHDCVLQLYLMSVVLGFPAYWFLLIRGWVRLWQFSLSGFCLGVLSGVTFAAWSCLKEGVFGSNESSSAFLFVGLFSVFWNVIHGLFIAASAWLFIRVIASDLLIGWKGQSPPAAHKQR